MGLVPVVVDIFIVILLFVVSTKLILFITGFVYISKYI